MPFYLYCRQEWTELLIDVFSLAAFLKSLFQRWPWQIGSNTQSYFLSHFLDISVP